LLASGIEDGFEFDVFRRRERSADILAQRGCRSGQTQCAFSLELRRRGGSETLEQAGNAALVIECLKNSQAFPIERVRGGTIALIPCQVSEIGQRAGDAPAVAKFAEYGETLSVEFARDSGVTLIASGVTLMV
jgi:hypothetical protein